ncbi:hypothetical protein Tco_0634145, partial [Tanacetum coccineum]
RLELGLRQEEFIGKISKEQMNAVEVGVAAC